MERLMHIVNEIDKNNEMIAELNADTRRKKTDLIREILNEGRLELLTVNTNMIRRNYNRMMMDDRRKTPRSSDKIEGKQIMESSDSPERLMKRIHNT